jgi:SPP1 family phage portal protein
MYITEQDLINARLAVTGMLQDSQIIGDLIDADETAKTDMQDGIDYYKGDHDILDREIKYWVDGIEYTDDNATNNQVVHPFLTYLIDQKSNYICGNPITFKSEDENDPVVELAETITDEYFDETMIEYIKGAGVKGYETLHPFINEKGEFDFVIIPAEQCILIYDSLYQRDLIYVIRYYEFEYIDTNKVKKTGYKVEWWDKYQVKYYVQKEDGGEYILDPNEPVNPRPHWIESMVVAGQPVEGTEKSGSWGKVPFIILKNNAEFQPDLKVLKPMIDDYDLNISEFSNNLEDIQEAYWVLKGYQGQNLNEFRTNLKKYRAIQVDEEGGVETQKVEIPKDPRDSHLDRLEENIFIFGRGLNPKTDVFGNSPSGVALRWLFTPMEIKCNGTMRSLTVAVKELVWFLAQYTKIKDGLDIDTSGLQVVFNKNLLINETETIDNVIKSKGTIDQETALANHPWVKNVDETIKKLAEENEARLELFDDQESQGGVQGSEQEGEEPGEVPDEKGSTEKTKTG